MHRTPATSAIFLFLVSLLSGCTTTPTGPQCINDVCLADPDSLDARFMREEYGLHQITADEIEEGRLMVEGDLVIWQTDTFIEDVPVTDIMGYRFSSRSLVEIGVSDHHLQSRPFLESGRVVFTQEPKPGADDYPGGSYLMLWDSRDGKLERLPVPLNGSQDSFAFDGDWVVLGNRFSNNASENALWAFNVDDERLIHLYTPPPSRKQPDGSYESLGLGQIVDDGIAYYTVTRTTADRSHSNWTLHAMNLETEGREELYFGELKLMLLEIDEDRLLVDADLKPFIMDLKNYSGGFKKISDGAGGGHTIEKNILIYSYSDFTNDDEWPFGLIIEDIESNQTILDLREYGFSFSTTAMDADENHIVVKIHRARGEIFENIGEDLYYMDLPQT